MFERILVPLDGSRLAECSLPHVECFARAFHSQIILLRVLDLSAMQVEAGMIDPLKWQILKAEADRYLYGIASNLKEKGISTEYFLLEGVAAENIIEFSHRENINLVVLCSHGQSGLTRWNVSSVTHKVLEKIYLPVLIVRSYLSMGSNGAPDIEVSYSRILLPVDGSRRAECSLPAAIALSEESNGTILLANIVRRGELPFPGPNSEEIKRISDELDELNLRAADQYLADVKNRIPVGSEVRVVEGDNVTTALHDLAEKENVDLVILCAHGQSGQMHWPYGCVASNYIYYGNATSLVIQDYPWSQVKPTAVEIATEKYGKR